MAGTYYAVSQEELESLLLPMGFKQVFVQGTRELVFGKRIDRDGFMLTLRVYTGIKPTGVSRGCGEDAMRVCLFIRFRDGRVVKLGGSKRVHRVHGWRTNLSNRIDNWEGFLPDHRCLKCGNPLLPRKGKNGDFAGCSSYPTCRYTEAAKQ